MAKAGGSVARVRAALEAAGLAAEIRDMPASTRTAEEAASACGCELDQIVKSLIFARTDGSGLVLLLVAGGGQADMDRAARAAGGALERADPKRVRAETGFAIGGVAPIGGLAPLPVFHDPRLLDFDLIWGAAGAPNAVFSVDPRRLFAAIGAKPF